MVQERAKPLSCCDLCGMRMPAGRFIKHQWTEQCEKNNHMRWRRRDVVTAEKFLEDTFSLTGEDGEKYIDVEEVFK